VFCGVAFGVAPRCARNDGSFAPRQLGKNPAHDAALAFRLLPLRLFVADLATHLPIPNIRKISTTNHPPKKHTKKNKILVSLSSFSISLYRKSNSTWIEDFSCGGNPIIAIPYALVCAVCHHSRSRIVYGKPTARTRYASGLHIARTSAQIKKPQRKFSRYGLSFSVSKPYV
jgi:hypothetical protein